MNRMPVGTEFLNNICLQNLLCFPMTMPLQALNLTVQLWWWIVYRKHWFWSLHKTTSCVGLLVSWGLALQFATVATLQWLYGSLPHYFRLLTQPSLNPWFQARVLPHSDIQSSLLEVLPFSLLVNYFPHIFVSLGPKIPSKYPPPILLHNQLQKNSTTETFRMWLLSKGLYLPLII